MSDDALQTMKKADSQIGDDTIIYNLFPEQRRKSRRLE